MTALNQKRISEADFFQQGLVKVTWNNILNGNDINGSFYK